jgi:hypothetical protein
MQRTIRIIKLIFLAIALLLCLAIPVVGFISTVINWQGICYGFTGGQSPCSWWEFAQGEMFWASMIFIPFMFLLSVVWILIAIAQFITARWGKQKNKA